MQKNKNSDKTILTVLSVIVSESIKYFYPIYGLNFLYVIFWTVFIFYILYLGLSKK